MFLKNQEKICFYFGGYLNFLPRFSDLYENITFLHHTKGWNQFWWKCKFLFIFNFHFKLIERPIKFMFFKKATKIDEIFTINLTVTTYCQIGGEDFINFFGLLRKCKLYSVLIKIIIKKNWPWKSEKTGLKSCSNPFISQSSPDHSSPQPSIMKSWYQTSVLLSVMGLVGTGKLKFQLASLWFANSNISTVSV